LIPVNRPLIEPPDIEAVTLALTETYISGETPPVIEMEAALSRATGSLESIAVSTGTTAIDLAIEALDIQRGDHCVVPNFTIISSVANLLRKGAKVELIDADPLTWSMDANAAVAAITPKTKLVLPVHIYGLPVDMDPVLAASSNAGSFVLEDAAEALGVKYKDKPCGSLGDVAVFSFYANKIVTGGEGGAITTSNEELAKNLRGLRNLAHSKDRFVHYRLGWNARISGLSAALIGAQLERLESLIQRKHEIADLYLDGLRNHPWLTFMPREVPYSTNAFWVFPILLNANSPYDAENLQLNLKGLGIESRRFFCPIHLQPLRGDFNLTYNSNYSVSEKLWRYGLYLPSGLGNTKQEIEQVIETFWKMSS